MILMRYIRTVRGLDRHSFDWQRYIVEKVFGPGNIEVVMLKHILNRYPVKSALDITCGNGNIAIMIAKMGKDVTVLDHDLANIQRVKQKSILAGVQIELKHADMRDLSSIYKHKCNLITCLNNSLSLLLDKADIWGSLVQMYLALEPGGLLVIQNFNYDRLIRDNISKITDINVDGCDMAVKVFFEHGNEKKRSRFVFETLYPSKRTGETEKLVIPVKPVFKKEMDVWLAELGFVKSNEEMYVDCMPKETWHTVTTVFRPGSLN